VVPELGGTTTVVALAGGGVLVTHPLNSAATTNKLDAILIIVSSFKFGLSRKLLSRSAYDVG
jgi:hypothetical protein